MNVRCSVNPGLVLTGPFLCASAPSREKKEDPACDRLSFFARVFFIRLSQRSLSADRQAKPLRCFDLSDSPSLRDILFLFTQRRREAKPQRGLIFATPLLCEIYFFLREKIKILENKPSLLALACKSLVPWSLKNEPNFRSPQKSKVTCHEFAFLHILKAN